MTDETCQRCGKDKAIALITVRPRQPGAKPIEAKLCRACGLQAQIDATNANHDVEVQELR